MTTSSVAPRVLPNEIRSALGPVRDVQDNLRGLGRAFARTGNTGMAEECAVLADELEAAMERIMEIADFHFDAHLQSVEQSSANMLHAALTVARHFVPKDAPPTAGGEVTS